MEKFLVTLQGIGAEELGGLLCGATQFRVNVLDVQGMDIARALGVGFPLPELEHANFQLNLAQVIRQLQENGYKATAGSAMIWLHSVRAVGFPELRVYGRKIWEELERGFPYVNQAFDDEEKLSGEDLSRYRKEANFIPPLLDKRNMK